jgi:hypothetical protein
MKKILIFAVGLLILSASVFGNGKQEVQEPVNIEDVMSVAKEVAAMFDYYDEINPYIENLIVGPNEIGGQCGDYSLAFVNIWNERYPKQKARLVVQQQIFKQIPDGIYEVVRKDNRSLPFTKNWKESGIYYTDDGGTIGLYHPILDNYIIRLVKRVHVKSHFNLPNWEDNGPHVWVMIGDIVVDPTYADFLGDDFIIGKDTY